MTSRRVLDLFCGAGGLTIGFKEAGFDVRGVDKLPIVRDIFERNELGVIRVKDLHWKTENGGADIVIGGPPCRPWSTLNLTRRRDEHANYRLMARFMSHVLQNHPKVFLMENVPPARSNATRVLDAVDSRMRKKGYKTQARTVKYSDYGAATSRSRMLLFGTRTGDPSAFFEELETHHRREPATVRDAIWNLRHTDSEAVLDHQWPRLNTIEKYRERYRTGQFGWYRLKWDDPAPSFGNVMKTYTLHPSSWRGNPPRDPRVISIREALSLMGFPEDYSFPPGMGMGLRYQMVVDSVSPVFSKAAAEVIASLL
ncbi:MAG: DNA cytosine methyltransferase [Nitrososphaerota archaeon]|nr:DNA cytosine methyltransferase [Nitrososphaerota archaeon]